MNAVGCDLYNFALTGGVACALNANTGLSANHAGPSVLIEKEAIIFSIGSMNSEGMLSKNPKSGIHETEVARAVCYAVDCRNNEINEEISGTLQAHNLGGWSVNCTNPVMYERHEDDGGISD